MTPDLLDIGFPPADPAVLVADVKAAGARAVGLYVINLSAPNTVQTPAYAQAVYAGGVQVVPIITPGQNPPPVTGVPAALKAWGKLNSDNAVAQDIEQPGISTPPVAWVSALADTLAAGGYQPWTYTNLLAYFGIGRLWAVDWDHGDKAVIPPGAVGVQYSPEWRGPSGASYDPNYLIPSALGGSMATLDDVMTKLQQHDAMLQNIATVLGWTEAEAGEADKALVWGAGHGGPVPDPTEYGPKIWTETRDLVKKLATATGADPNALAAALAGPLGKAVLAEIKSQWAK